MKFLLRLGAVMCFLGPMVAITFGIAWLDPWWIPLFAIALALSLTALMAGLVGLACWLLDKAGRL